MHAHAGLRDDLRTISSFDEFAFRGDLPEHSHRRIERRLVRSFARMPLHRNRPHKPRLRDLISHAHHDCTADDANPANRKIRNAPGAKNLSAFIRSGAVKYVSYDNDAPSIAVVVNRGS